MPVALESALAPVTLVVGHYGVGKTNFSCNVAVDLARGRGAATLIDLDVVNPYFRASEQRASLEADGVRVIAPLFAEAGSSLDNPSLPGSIQPALAAATAQAPVVVDVGGDDAGTVALGRFRRTIAAASHAALGVVNGFRNLVADPVEAARNLHDIQAASGLLLTALVDNGHLKEHTTVDTVVQGFDHARQVAEIMKLPLVAVTVPAPLADQVRVQGAVPSELVYAVDVRGKTPWE